MHLKQLLTVLNRLVEKGNTVVVIEHNLDVIKTADFIIDLGPEGGDAGGTIIATGTPEKVSKMKPSYTGQFLKKDLNEVMTQPTPIHPQTDLLEIEESPDQEIPAA